MKRLMVIFFVILLACISISCSGNGKTVEVQPVTEMKAEEAVESGISLREMKGKEGGSEIFAIQGTNGADDGFEKLMKLMEGHGQGFYKSAAEDGGLIGKEDVVLLKINCQWYQRGGTNTDLIKSVVNAIVKHPEGFEGEIIIADNGQSQYGPFRKGGSVEWKENNSVDIAQSVLAVAEAFAKEHRVSAITWDAITEKQVNDYSHGDYQDGFILEGEETSTGFRISYPKFTTKYGTYVNFKEGIWDDGKHSYDSSRLKVINMPVLKSHINYHVTASIKSYMGTTSDRLTGHKAHNSVALGGMGTQMAATRVPVLNIIDAIWINPYPKRGPSTSYKSAVETDIVAASTDPGALDYWASKYILMETAKRMNLNGYEPMDPESSQPGDFGYWLGKSVEELRRAGIKSTLKEDEMTVYVYSPDK